MRFHPGGQGSSGRRKIVLVGNPNTGKSVLFGELAKVFAEASNYPGTTLLLREALLGNRILVDTPGVYGLHSGREEEQEVLTAVMEADLIINVMDATNLERGLWLTLELLDLGKPTIVVLNMWDEVEKNGVSIDVQRLRTFLGIPVFTTVATKGVGVREVAHHVKARASEPLGGASVTISPEHATRTWPSGIPGAQAGARRQRIEAILRGVQKEVQRPGNLRDLLSDLMIRPLTGVPMALGILSAVFYLIGTYVAQDLVEFTEGFIFKQLYEPAVRHALGMFLSGPLYEILAGEFGVLTMTVTYVFGLLVPLVFAFYVMMAVLEDTGYLPRLATLADRTFAALGMSGKAVIPIVLGFGCVTLATVTTRMLGRSRERTIAIALLALAVPCSAQTAVILVLLAGLGFLYWALYGTILLTVFLLIGLVLSHLIPGQRSELIYELPRLRLPKVGNVLRKAGFRLWIFIKDVFLLFLLGALIISVLLVTGILDLLQEALRPLVVGWLGLPPEAARALIMGFVRRDFGAAGFFHMSLTAVQAVVGMLVITLFVPCIASFMVIHRELGAKGVLGILAFTLVVAFLTGGIVFRILSPFLGG